MVSDVGAGGMAGVRRVGRPLVSRDLLTVSLWMPNSLATRRLETQDMPEARLRTHGPEPQNAG